MKNEHETHLRLPLTWSVVCPTVLVHFHPSFNGLTVPHGWGGLTIMEEGERHISYGGKQEKRACAGKVPFLKPSDLRRLIHYHENSTGKTWPHDPITSHWFPPTTCGHSR
uniref:Uncharacterized protein n=1 Tax=Cebus imitator TaxID=2715852 RepID=A0A2K5PCV6_CEBIM